MILLNNLIFEMFVIIKAMIISLCHWIIKELKKIINLYIYYFFILQYLVSDS